MLTDAVRPTRSLLLLLAALPCGIAMASMDVPTENIVPNGDFSKGNVGFTSQLPYIKPADNCLWGGYYTIAPKFNTPQLHQLIRTDAFQAPHRPNGNEKVMFMNAGGVEPLKLWESKFPCKPNTTYKITFYAISLSGDGYDQDTHQQIAGADWQPELQIDANDAPSVPTMAGLDKYFKVSMIWDSRKETTVDLKITRLKIQHGGGLIGLANIEMVPIKL